MNERMIIYTAIFGGKDELKDPVDPSGNCDYVCFTDDPAVKSDIYDVRLCGRQFADPTREARRYKILPHLFFPEYEYSLWIDASVTLYSISFDELSEQLPNGTDILLFAHPERDCIYDELRACLNFRKDSPRVMRKQVENYRNEGYPKHNGLIVSTFMFRRHMSPAMIKFDEAWWEEMSRNSRRDQLSFNYLAWKHDFPYAIFQNRGDLLKNEYCEWGKHEIEQSWGRWWHKLQRRQRLNADSSNKGQRPSPYVFKRPGARGLIYFLIIDDRHPVDLFMDSPYGSQYSHKVIPLFYRKVFNKAGKGAVVKELWRQALKKSAREAVKGLPWSLGARTAGKMRMLAHFLRRYFKNSGDPPEGLYIFSDLELMSEELLEKAKAVGAILAESGPSVRTLNFPAHKPVTNNLLKTLYERGLSALEVYRWGDVPLPLKYPVLLRDENTRAVLPLVIQCRERLDRAIRDLEKRGKLGTNFSVIEFRDTADTAGVYRKYSAIVVGNRVFARNLSFSRNWMVRRSSEMKTGQLLAQKELLVEEEEYVRNNPHEEMLKKIFSATGIEYGRIDYSIEGGAFHVWEINTNPRVTYDGEARVGPRKPIFDLVEQRMADALEILSTCRRPSR